LGFGPGRTGSGFGRTSTPGPVGPVGPSGGFDFARLGKAVSMMAAIGALQPANSRHSGSRIRRISGE
jgi:hypothetical protein